MIEEKDQHASVTEMGDFKQRLDQTDNWSFAKGDKVSKSILLEKGDKL